MKAKSKIIILGLSLIVLAIIVFLYVIVFTAPQKQANVEQFNVSVGNDFEDVMEQLKAYGFIKSKLGFRLAFFGFKSFNQNCIDCITPGAYKLSKSINARDTVKILKNSPYMKWVTIPEGLRKEEIAKILADTLGWSEEEKSDWINIYTTEKESYFEGVYFPETYLIPVDETPQDTAKRMQSKFEEKFAPFSKEAQKQNIKWTTVIKIASIVQREAYGKDDMPVIAGIIWNRLLNDMKMDIDATVQYARGDKGKGFWAPVTADEIKSIDSPYNTYKYAGLPPAPISNPGLDAIGAVLFPEKTDCLFYLHDKNGEVHCSKTLEEHRGNIEKYL